MNTQTLFYTLALISGLSIPQHTGKPSDTQYRYLERKPASNSSCSEWKVMTPAEIRSAGGATLSRSGDSMKVTLKGPFSQELIDNLRLAEPKTIKEATLPQFSSAADIKDATSKIGIAIEYCADDVYDNFAELKDDLKLDSNETGKAFSSTTDALYGKDNLSEVVLIDDSDKALSNPKGIYSLGYAFAVENLNPVCVNCAATLLNSTLADKIDPTLLEALQAQLSEEERAKFEKSLAPLVQQIETANTPSKIATIVSALNARGKATTVLENRTLVLEQMKVATARLDLIRAMDPAPNSKAYLDAVKAIEKIVASVPEADARHQLFSTTAAVRNSMIQDLNKNMTQATTGQQAAMAASSLQALLLDSASMAGLSLEQRLALQKQAQALTPTPNNIEYQSLIFGAEIRGRDLMLNQVDQQHQALLQMAQSVCNGGIPALCAQANAQLHQFKIQNMQNLAQVQQRKEQVAKSQREQTEKDKQAGGIASAPGLTGDASAITGNATAANATASGVPGLASNSSTGAAVPNAENLSAVGYAQATIDRLFSGGTVQNPAATNPNTGAAMVPLSNFGFNI